MDNIKYLNLSLEGRIKAINKIVTYDTEIISNINQVISLICNAYRRQKKVIFFGNGGSASQAQHFAAELMGRFKMERRALRAIALTTNNSILTAVGNDYNFSRIFSRQIEGLVDKGDIVIGISTSGNSPNVIEGIKEAKSLGAKTIGFTGGKKNKLAEEVDLNIAIPSENTPVIQELHLIIGHLICELVEKQIFS